MGEIILGYDPMLVMPTSARIKQGDFLSSLKLFDERTRRGERMLPFPVRWYEGEIIAMDGHKRLVIAYLESLRVDLYVANSKRDGIMTGQMECVDDIVRASMNRKIWGGFWRAPRALLDTRFEGVMDVRDLIEKNREEINSAYISVFGRGIEGLPIRTC